MRYLFNDVKGAAAAEMALVVPLLLVLMMGPFELGNYFLNEHKLVKAVRDGARFAARQGFANYPCGGSIGGTVVNDTRNVVMAGLVSGGSARIVNWAAPSITLTFSCSTATGGQNMLGIYRTSTGTSAGAPIVTVSASVPYTPILHSYGFKGIGLNLNASQQAAVMGL